MVSFTEIELYNLRAATDFYLQWQPLKRVYSDSRYKWENISRKANRDRG